MTERDFFWLVGILEGEGCFIAGPPSRPNKPSVQMCSSDYDVAQRAHRLMGGSFYRRNRTPKWSKDTYRDIFEVKVSSRPALALMTALAPHMSRRRRQRIEVIVANTPPIGISPSTAGKLTAKDKILIRKKYAHGDFTQTQLAVEHGVSQSRISGIVRSKSGCD